MNIGTWCVRAGSVAITGDTQLTLCQMFQVPHMTLTCACLPVPPLPHLLTHPPAQRHHRLARIPHPLPIHHQRPRHLPAAAPALPLRQRAAHSVRRAGRAGDDPPHGRVRRRAAVRAAVRAREVPAAAPARRAPRAQVGRDGRLGLVEQREPQRRRVARLRGRQGEVLWPRRARGAAGPRRIGRTGWCFFYHCCTYSLLLYSIPAAAGIPVLAAGTHTRTTTLRIVVWCGRHAGRHNRVVPRPRM
ncbi:hypothetical protein BC834DRAFT_138964 [Gloeopeniophorella convolvens]|nr:hypothetical protein BC834DRAFT_138964 [Gloeopeniophorella convolvens]